MLTGTTFEAVAILAVIAVAHAVISTVIAKRLSAGEKAAGQNAGAARVFASTTPVSGSTPANDQFAKAA